MDGFCWGKYQSKMDDDWGYPYDETESPPSLASLTLAGEKKWVPMTLDGSCPWAPGEGPKVRPKTWSTFFGLWGIHSKLFCSGGLNPGLHWRTVGRFTQLKWLWKVDKRNDISIQHVKKWSLQRWILWSPYFQTIQFGDLQWSDEQSGDLQGTEATERLPEARKMMSSWVKHILNPHLVGLKSDKPQKNLEYGQVWSIWEKNHGVTLAGSTYFRLKRCISHPTQPPANHQKQ